MRRGVERVDAFVEVGRVVAHHGDREQKAEEQQNAGGGVETPGSTIRHGAETPVAAAVGAGKAGARIPVHRRRVQDTARKVTTRAPFSARRRRDERRPRAVAGNGDAPNGESFRPLLMRRCLCVPSGSASPADERDEPHAERGYQQAIDRRHDQDADHDEPEGFGAPACASERLRK